jgi:hypothetical protein
MRFSRNVMISPLKDGGLSRDKTAEKAFDASQISFCSEQKE